MSFVLTAGVVLAVLWLLGLISSHTMNGGIHVLLGLAIIMFVVWVLSRHK